MSKKPDFSSFTPSKLNPKAAKQFAEIDKIIGKATDKDKQKLIENGLSVKPTKDMVIMEVDIKKIVHPACFVRSKILETFEDLDMVTKTDPIKVVVTKVEQQYFLVSGERRLQHAKRNGKKKVKVHVIGTVVCQSQIGMARGKEMVKFKKPLTSLELAHGLMQLKDQIICDFGEDAFFSHGGDRKAKHETKKSLPDYMAKVLGLNSFTVDTLLRFGSNVGPMGLAGLLTKDDMVGMPLRQINQVNARLKNADVPKQIAERADELIKEGATRDDVIDEAGELARKMISQALYEGVPEDNDNNDDDNAEERDSSFLPPTQKWRNSKKDKNDDEPEDTKPARKKVKPIEIAKIITGMITNLQQLQSRFENSKKIDDIDRPIVNAKVKGFQGFLVKFYSKLDEVGLS
jgi:uncharacterized ParB-like nuclease family protein